MEINVNPNYEGNLPDLLIVNVGEQKIDYVAIDSLPKHVQEDIRLHLEVQKTREENGL